MELLDLRLKPYIAFLFLRRASEKRSDSIGQFDVGTVLLGLFACFHNKKIT